MKHGDFSSLAENYSKYRPYYSQTALDAISGVLQRPVTELDVADIGAGTGIWSRMIARHGFKSVTSVEPNDSMREQGKKDSTETSIKWIAGSAEATGLADGSADLITAASCFHWFDFETATAEIHRVLRKDGWFVALWNPRLLQANPELKAIEDKLYEIAPDIKRVSSGSSSFVEALADRLHANEHFSDVIYFEGRHEQKFTQEQYLGVWWSVNDIRFQAGEKRFRQFMDYVAKEISSWPSISVNYKTRAWMAKATR